MRESKIESDICKKAQEKGWLTFKFVSPSQRGVPDRIWIRKGKIVFVEFKAPGKEPTKLQEKIISKIRSHLFQVEVVDSKESGMKLIESLEK